MSLKHYVLTCIFSWYQFQAWCGICTCYCVLERSRCETSCLPWYVPLKDVSFFYRPSYGPLTSLICAENVRISNSEIQVSVLFNILNTFGDFVSGSANSSWFLDLLEENKQQGILDMLRCFALFPISFILCFEDFGFPSYVERSRGVACFSRYVKVAFN